MSVEAQLRELEHEITLAAAYAPDQYPSWSLRRYDTHMADLEHLWRAIRPKLKQDVETAAWIDLTLKKNDRCLRQRRPASGVRSRPGAAEGKPPRIALV